MCCDVVIVAPGMEDDAVDDTASHFFNSNSPMIFALTLEDEVHMLVAGHIAGAANSTAHIWTTRHHRKTHEQHT